MAGSLRREVLKAFKDIHRARLAVFKGDERILKDSREKINSEFRKNKAAGGVSVSDLVSYARAVALELRRTVVQAEEKEPGVFKLNIRPEIEMLENMPFNPDIEIPKRPRRKTAGCQEMRPCCQEEITPPTKVKSSK